MQGFYGDRNTNLNEHWTHADPYYQQQKCSPYSSFWQYKIYQDICGGSLDRGVRWEQGRRKGDFRLIPVATFSEVFNLRPTLLHCIMQFSICFSLRQQRIICYCHYCYYTLCHNRWPTVRVKKIPPWGLLEIFPKRLGIFWTKFYMPIMRSYLR